MENAAALLPPAAPIIILHWAGSEEQQGRPSEAVLFASDEVLSIVRNSAEKLGHHLFYYRHISLHHCLSWIFVKMEKQPLNDIFPKDSDVSGV